MSNVKQREKFIKIFPQRQVFLNSWRGPDRPNGKIMDLVRHMKFSLNNMDPEGKLSFLALRRRNISGKVKILRVNDIDNIWVWSDKQHRLYIVFIDAPTEIYYAIRVSVNKNAYVFSDLIADFSDKDISISGSYDEKREYCPYIYQLGDKSFAEIGVIHSDIASTWDEWHYKWYTFDCLPSSGSYNQDIEIWRPATQGFRKAFGYDLDPIWYSMSYYTAYSRYSKWNRAIDQAKRVYQPLSSTVKLEDGTIRKLVQVIETMNYYGKNNFTLDTNGKILTYGASAKIDRAVTVDCPVDIQPALYFWPWIPYMDDIGHFDIFAYGEKVTYGVSEGFFITPELDSFKAWEVRYYKPDGSTATIGNYPENGNFSDMPSSNNTVESNESPPCEGWGGSWQCGTNTYKETKTSVIGPYTSYGKRVIPIGVTGLDMIRMESSWNQSGMGRTYSDYNHSVTGSYPYTYEKRPEYVYGKAYYHDLFGPYVFKNVVDSTVDKTENYSNTMSLTQNLYIGNDVIFSGGGSLTYEAESTEHQKRDAEIYLKLKEIPYLCDAVISYTTTSMNAGESQTLSVDNPSPGAEYTWSLSGGGSLSTTSGNSTIYAAASGTNTNCTHNSTITLLCTNGESGEVTATDSLSITVNTWTGGEAAYGVKLGCEDAPTVTCVASNYHCCTILQYHCDGSYHGPTWWCTGGSPCSETTKPCYSSCAAVPSYTDYRTGTMITGGCCPPEVL